MHKIVIHDYAGHPFQLELSEQLSKTYKIYHLYFKNDKGPKANFDNENKNLITTGIGERINYSKKNFISRFFDDIKYGKLVSEQIRIIKPDLILSGNCPTISQHIILNSAKKNNSKFIIWVQDFYSLAVKILLKKKFSIFSFPIYYLFEFLEKKQLKETDKIIIISQDFKDTLIKWKIDENKIFFIPNWGNLRNINFYENKKLNFLEENNLETDKFYILYTGTLAMKHDPDLIVEIAKKMMHIKFLIIGFGSGYDNLKKRDNLPKNINLFPIQPFEKIDNILSSADLCLSILNKEASTFSVPSKILNYLCAGKTILLCAPKNNLASKIIENSRSGKIFEPNNINNMIKFIQEIYEDKNLKKKYSINARKYAEKNFDIKNISQKFEKIFKDISF